MAGDPRSLRRQQYSPPALIYVYSYYSTVVVSTEPVGMPAQPFVAYIVLTTHSTEAVVGRFVRVCVICVPGKKVEQTCTPSAESSQLLLHEMKRYLLYYEYPTGRHTAGSKLLAIIPFSLTNPMMVAQ